MKFPESFCLSVIEKHWDNEKGSLKKICSIRHKKERKSVQSQSTCTSNHGRFQGTDDQSCFEGIRRTQYPTHQSPGKYDTSISVIRLYCQWLFQTIHEERNDTQIRSQDLESITIDFKLSTVKLLHTKWVMEAYNHMTSSIGKDICLKGWKKRGI